MIVCITKTVIPVENKRPLMLPEIDVINVVDYSY